jgi:membrane protein YdbS with pleckstrin-like domain
MSDTPNPAGPAPAGGNAASPGAASPGAEAAAPHRPADDREMVYFEGSPLLRGAIGHVLAFMGPALLLFLLPFLLWWFMGDWPNGWLVAILWLLAVGLGVWPLILVRSIRYRISNYRIDFERGILSKKIDTLELWHVDDISFYQSLSDRLLNVGTIIIISGDKTTPKLKLMGLPDPRPLFNSLQQRIISVKRQRGVVKMDAS